MNSQDEKIAKMTFAMIYPSYVKKVEKKGRTEAELQQIIAYLTGFDVEKQQEHIKENTTFSDFFAAATLPKNANLITGTICGVKIAEITNPLTKNVRYLDKLVDELAKGKAMEKIMR